MQRGTAARILYAVYKVLFRPQFSEDERCRAASAVTSGMIGCAYVRASIEITRVIRVAKEVFYLRRTTVSHTPVVFSFSLIYFSRRYA